MTVDVVEPTKAAFNLLLMHYLVILIGDLEVISHILALFNRVQAQLFQSTYIAILTVRNQTRVSIEAINSSIKQIDLARSPLHPTPPT